MDDFSLIDEEAFGRLEHAQAAKVAPTVRHNYCTTCNIPMTRSSNIWTCAVCGVMNSVDGEVRDCDENASANLQFRAGNKVWRINGDYGRAQYKEIVDQLTHNNTVCKPSLRIPPVIIDRVAASYNEIQKLENVSSAVNGIAKKFVKRGNNKDEILAALTFNECTKASITRKKGDIAEWMMLKKRGFSRGEGTLKTLKASDKIKIQLDVESKDSFIDRYLNAVGIMDGRHRKFVADLVQKSFDHYIGTNSVVPTKVVGAIWVLVCREDIAITVDTLQDKCDNIKKNTFMKFVKAVEDNIDILADVFAEHEVSLVAKR